MDDQQFEEDLRRNSLRVEEGRWGWTVGRSIAAVLVLVMLAFWTWAFLWSPRGHPDELDSTTFPEFAEESCSVALEELSQVPGASTARDLEDRAVQLETTTAILSLMVADLRAEAPKSGDDAELVARWLADWETYLSDRLAYAADFRAGIDKAFSVTAVDGDQVTSALDLFATINRMPSCIAPGDV
ncbi:MAG: hypothetical protein ACR2PK_17530 [Acidimicrobiales bacterium]